MTDEHYRAINRAIAYVGDSDMERYTKMAYIDLQDIREKARSSLHHIFGREKKLRERLDQCKARWEGAANELARLREQNKDQLHQQEWYEAELARLREDNEELSDTNFELVGENDRLEAQRDTLLAALREIADPEIHDADWRAMRHIANTAIGEVEGKTT